MSGVDASLISLIEFMQSVPPEALKLGELFSLSWRLKFHISVIFFSYVAMDEDEQLKDHHVACNTRPNS